VGIVLESFFLKSLDGGKTWENLSSGILQATNRDPLSYSGVNEIKVFKGILFAYVPSYVPDSWYFSVDEGMSFKKLDTIASIFLVPNYDLMGTSKFGVYRSDDGLNWNMVYKQNIPTSSFAYDKENKTLYVVDPFRGVFYSRDGGKTG